MKQKVGFFSTDFMINVRNATSFVVKQLVDVTMGLSKNIEYILFKILNLLSFFLKVD